MTQEGLSPTSIVLKYGLFTKKKKKTTKNINKLLIVENPHYEKASTRCSERPDNCDWIRSADYSDQVCFTEG